MFQQMKYFIAVVDQHNFTRAAEENNISQSAISQQIKELENTLDVKLLDRKGRSFELTTAGEFFYQHAKEVVKTTNALIVKTRRIGKLPINYELCLGYLSNFGTNEFLHTVAHFSQMYPEIEIKIKSGTHEELFELLKQDQIDLAFSDQRRALSNEYHNEFLTETDFMAVLPLKYPDNNRISTTQLADLPCILVTNDPQKAAEEQYYRDGLGVKSRFLTVATIDEAQMMVAANRGYFIVNRRTQSLINKEIVKIMPLYAGDVPLHQNYYAYWKQGNSGFYIEKFAELLKAQF
ncbi:LysR family transcriptional regulator [Limosilactobacillus albertensis]|uniref:LysR family transcriptional regulator n=1 Tax=Limosilactobacillus albertensis TaxID=2759752 RepID=A0A839HAF8_9LACO|nr:LysR family transcriptional regulator [Limosilactobacillus albertensis]MBB1124168.1 LysR family transcriptional regulator [Limosilactobacillus albertensis]MCD7122042.1 LysR family transcriptional regulator [Limosilactobacillus albertensis]